MEVRPTPSVPRLKLRLSKEWAIKSSRLIQYSFGAGIAVGSLAGCNGSQPPISVPSTTQQTTPIAPASSYKIVHSFVRNKDGLVPVAGLIDVNGTLYGTTDKGGDLRCKGNYPGCGTVYGISTNGSEHVLHKFSGGSDGAFPLAGLLNVNGMLYGTTSAGGSSNKGTVFSVSLSGAEKVLYSFVGGADGGAPGAGLIDVKGTLYGTTYNGGGSCDCGTVYSITTSGAEKVVYAFAGGSDGAYPSAGLIDVKGVLYGTTSSGGGSGPCSFGCGTVYSVSATGAEKVLHAFDWYDGAEPLSGLIDANGTLYGTTWTGTTAPSGINGCGTVYSVSTNGAEKVLYSFSCLSDGSDPAAGVIRVKGTLYGTTYYGGSSNFGTVYSVTLSGKERVLHAFHSHSGPDGINPEAPLINANGTLYGTTAASGSNGCGGVHRGCGTVFALTP